ncbi:hypothetical protein SUNI508_02556 [Seiridium unicorne]|uniref:Nitrate reductase [NADPH] n=1 Tax=Seiridium unicorne TaxID=138068 RepID=A0ABR2UFG4_9PEZI
MPQPPRETKKGAFPGSSVKEIENEPNWGAGHNHRIGYKNDQSRFAGLTHDGDEHWGSDEEKRFAEDAMERYRKLRQRYNRSELLNFQDIMEAQTASPYTTGCNCSPMADFAPRISTKGIRTIIQRYGTGSSIQQRTLSTNIKARQKEEEEKKKEKKKGGETKENGDKPKGTNHNDSHNDEPSLNESDEDSQGEHSPECDNEAEDNWRQNRGGEHSDKHNGAYGSGNGIKNGGDTEYKKLREKYTPQEISLLQALRHEKQHMQALEQNDGSIISPVQSQGIMFVIGWYMLIHNRVPRSANLIRQTGQHPLNAEPRLTELFKAGIITPNQLHYVRNHGAVPRLFWETHILDINNGQMRLTMDDLVGRFEPINIAMAMACDGVRRGELNMIRKSKGFTWGAGAMSNAYWKGARLADVFKAAGISRDSVKSGKRLYVHFEGSDQLSEGKYATSIAYDHVIDPMNDVILAYEMNNTKLPPDHGFPVRVVIPGYVGGRCVKWLSRIWISDKENDSYYHVWDNRVLPSFITEKDGEFAQTMFRHPDTACYEQNLNSVIARPAHDEKLDLTEMLKEDTYRIEGMAYDGGGHKVQRVEVSLDEGQTWLYAIRKFPEKPVRHGDKFWTWCFWHVDVDTLHFSRAQSIVVRAFNVFKNTQPREPVWNVMGMMNNCWYRVKMAEDRQVRKLRCQHPVDTEGDSGWMKPSTINQLAAAKQTSGVPDKQFTRQEIEKHSSKDDCWLVINNTVYDATSVLSWHPGGPATIAANAGKLTADVTSAFESIHDEYAHKKLQECAIGRVTDKAAQFIQEQAKKAAAEAARSDPAKSKTLLQSKRWTSVKLTRREKLTEDTFQYTFQYSDKDSSKRLGLETCQHIQFGIHMLDKMLVRSYTPTRPILQNEDDGTFDLVLKTYFPDENQPGGAFSNMLYKMEIGEDVQVSGPTGEIEYKGNGKFRIEGNEVLFDKVNLILGGSGITPGYQLLERILRTPGDRTQIRMVDANRTEGDILLRDEMEKLRKKHPDQFAMTQVLSHPSNPDGWQGETGHINADIIRKACFEPGKGVACFLCGPPAMIQKAALPSLVDWGFEEDKNLYGF